MSENTTPTEGDIRVWWIPQIPGKPFLVPVDTVEQGHALEEVLANYDLFQFEQNIKPDYSNAGGTQVFEDGDWYDAEEPEDA